MLPPDDRDHILRWLDETNLSFHSVLANLPSISDPAAYEAVSDLAVAINNLQSSVALIVNAL